MAEITRLGPMKSFTDCDEDGNLLDHWKVVNLTFTVRCFGADGEQYYQHADCAPDLMPELWPSVFEGLEYVMKNRMIEEGLWVE